jgi:hypothetical protein
MQLLKLSRTSQTQLDRQVSVHEKLTSWEDKTASLVWLLSWLVKCVHAFHNPCVLYIDIVEFILLSDVISTYIDQSEVCGGILTMNCPFSSERDQKTLSNLSEQHGTIHVSIRSPIAIIPVIRIWATFLTTWYCRPCAEANAFFNVVQLLFCGFLRHCTFKGCSTLC